MNDNNFTADRIIFNFSCDSDHREKTPSAFIDALPEIISDGQLHIGLTGNVEGESLHLVLRIAKEYGFHGFTKEQSDEVLRKARENLAETMRDWFLTSFPRTCKDPAFNVTAEFSGQ